MPRFEGAAMELLQRKAGAVAGEGKGKAEGQIWPVIRAKAKAKVKVLTLLRLRDQMKQQLMEQRTAVHSKLIDSVVSLTVEEMMRRRDQENDLYDIAEQNFIDSAAQNLEEDVEEAKVSLQNKTLAVQRNQVMISLRNKMNQNDNDSRLILETLKHILRLTSSVLRYQQKARENEQKLNDIKMKRLSLKRDGRQKLLEIRTIRKKQKEERVRILMSGIMEKIQYNLKKEREVTTVIQNVFQNIVIASGVDWAEDPSLRAKVLQLEKNYNFL